MNLEGCSNHGCIIKKPVGMGTNGRCNCLTGLPTKNRLQVERKIRLLERVIKAQENLIKCYRVGSSPPEWVLETFEAARKNGIEC